MIFQGIRTSIAKKTLYFCEFREGGPDPLPPSGPAHGLEPAIHCIKVMLFYVTSRVLCISLYSLYLNFNLLIICSIFEHFYKVEVKVETSNSEVF